MRGIIILISLTLFSLDGMSQFFNRIDWKANRHQVEFGLGASNFLGELGGKDAIGTDDFQDLEWSENNFGLFVAYKYTVYKKTYLKTALTYGTVSGDDKLTEEPFRQNRNLHFRSRIWELTAVLEYELPINFRKGHIYDIKGARGWKNGGSSLFVFGGVGVFRYNPTALVDGEWLDLKPLRTEGQGLPGGADEYSNFGLSIPVGLALSKRVGRRFSLAIEAGYRYTFTDYIDDVSTEYYNPLELAVYLEEDQKDVAMYLSNPSLGPAQGGFSNNVTAPGQQRGDETDDDGYMFVFLKGQFLLNQNKNASKIVNRLRPRKRSGRRVVF